MEICINHKNGVQQRQKNTTTTFRWATSHFPEFLGKRQFFHRTFFCMTATLSFGNFSPWTILHGQTKENKNNNDNRPFRLDKFFSRGQLHSRTVDNNERQNNKPLTWRLAKMPADGSVFQLLFFNFVFVPA